MTEREMIQRHLESVLDQIDSNIREIRKHVLDHPASITVQAGNISRNANELSYLAGRLRGDKA
ncbi:MAG TPA: hypothetical protein VIY48_08960 [Candidatus Paceibacterota bacterium]